MRRSVLIPWKGECNVNYVKTVSSELSDEDDDDDDDDGKKAPVKARPAISKVRKAPTRARNSSEGAPKKSNGTLCEICSQFSEQQVRGRENSS